MKKQPDNAPKRLTLDEYNSISPRPRTSALMTEIRQVGNLMAQVVVPALKRGSISLSPKLTAIAEKYGRNYCEGGAECNNRPSILEHAAAVYIWNKVADAHESLAVMHYPLIALCEYEIPEEHQFADECLQPFGLPNELYDAVLDNQDIL